MSRPPWIGAVLVVTVGASVAQAFPGHYPNLDRVNACLNGHIVDFTHNHGSDNRIWSEALCEKRDLYVYLPPGFDPSCRYPLLMFLHAFRQDETDLLDSILPRFDQAMSCGELPPAIVVVPDGSIQGRPSLFSAGSFFINSKAGAFEDFIIKDVVPFVEHHFPIRPERAAHVLMGASMGGFGAFNLGIKYRCYFHIVVGIFPPVNLRWLDCHCRYRHTEFDPCCWGWRQHIRPCEVIARFYCIPIRMKRLVTPLYGRDEDEALAGITRENPVEMLGTYNVQPCDLAMYIGYAGKDQFNIQAQVDSFLYVARCRGLCVETEFLPDGKHDLKTGLKLFPGAAAWLAPKLAPYSPPSAHCGPQPGTPFLIGAPGRP